MRTFFLCFLAASCLPAQQLTVRSATARRVELVWAGSSAEWQVERRSGSGQFEKLGASSAASYSDEKIGPYTTYHYRVRNQAGTVSNEVVVGPPPAGINVPSRLPAQVEPGKYGTSTALASDENGDPALAFIWTDVNGDNDNSDNTLYFVRWNRAAYTWRAPVKVAVTGDIPAQNVDPVSLACDRATGAFALSFPVAGAQGIQVALSRDEGASWQAAPLAADLEGAVSSTAMVVAGGRWMLALSGEQGIRFFSVPVAAAPANWTAQAAPPSDKGKFVSNTNVALAADPAGHPLVAYWVQPEDGQNYHVLIWSPDSGQVTAAADSNNQVPDGANVRLVATSGKTHLLLNSLREANDFDHAVWYAVSSAAAWNAPVKLPIDGPRSTNSPFALAVDSRGRIAAVFDANGGTGDTSCGYPVVSLSSDGTHWSTCGLGKRTGGTFDKQSSSINAQFGPDDRLNVVWHQEGDNKYGTGVLLWRE